MAVDWNPWHGCHKKSEGCKYCYVYRRDSRYELDSSAVYKTKNFDLPTRKNKKGEYVVKKGSFIWTCFTSDFFLEDADEWRIEAWKMIKERSDCKFFFITKRIERFNVNLPSDWFDGYSNVHICSTCENQKRLDERMPIFLNLPIKHKSIVCEPLLEEIDIEKYLTDEIEGVVVGGESGVEARICDYNWVLKIREACIKKNVKFTFRQTGAHFLKDGKVYTILKKYQSWQAKKANINYSKKKIVEK